MAGQATIKGGTIRATGSSGIGINVNSGTLTLGDNSNGVSITEPLVQATSNIGVQKGSSGTVNFYDGKIQGTSSKSI